MNYKNNDIPTVSTDLLELYLEREGWKRIEFLNPRPFDCYETIINEKRYQLKIPNNKLLDDYDAALKFAIKNLSLYEGEDVNDLIDTIINPQCDIIKIRKSDSRIFNGSMPLDDAIAFFENSKKLLASAAMDLTAKIKYRTGKYTKEVDSFIKNCRFGQTQQGSYVISIICPMNNLDEQNREQIDLFNAPNDYQYSFSRRVVNKLNKSINDVKIAVSQGKNLNELIDSSDDNFVSLNFMESLSLLESESDNNSFIEIKTDWDPSTKNNRNDIGTIVIKQSIKNNLESFVRDYKSQSTPDQIISIEGLVEDASAEPVLANRTKGIVRIIDLNNKQKKYNVELSIEYYQTALDAHAKGKPVFVDGVKKDKMISNASLKVKKTLFDEN